MAVGMEQLQVVQAILATVYTPDPVVDLPLFFLLQELSAATTASSLLLPQIRDLRTPGQGCLHPLEQPSLEVPLPCRVIRVGLAANLHMPLDAYSSRLHQADGVRLSLTIPDSSGKHPTAVPEPLEVFLLDPLPAFLTMALAAPTPEHATDPRIHVAKGALTARMTVIHRPALDLWIQGPDQFSRRAVASLPLYYFPDPGPATTGIPLPTLAYPEMAIEIDIFAIKEAADGL